MKFLNCLAIIACLVLVSSCGSDDPTFITIEEYIANNNLVTQTTASGLQYTIEIPGGMEKPTSTSNVKVAVLKPV